MTTATRLAHVDYEPTANCVDCDWQHQSSAGTLVRAKQHVQETQHRVRVERLTVSLYGPR